MMLVSLLKLLLLAISFIGYSLLCIRQWKLETGMVPVIVLSSTGVYLFLAGLLNIFTVAETVLFFGGLFLFGIFIIKSHFKFSVNVRDLVLVCVFFFVCLWILYLVRGGVIWGHDNLAHWAIVVKRMVSENRLPNFTDDAIEFTGYPVGTAVLLKYFCNVLGFSDGVMLFAQSVLLFSCVYSAVIFVQKPLDAVFVCLWGVFAITFNVTPDDLRVDTLLALLGFAAACIVFYYRNDCKKALLSALPVLSFLSVVKNSGLLFVLFVFIGLIFYARKGQILPGKQLIAGLAASCFTFGLYYLWTRHVAICFSNSGADKHAVSAAAYTSAFQAKTKEQIQNFFQLFRDHFCQLSNTDVLALFLLLGIAIVAFAWLVITGRLCKKEAIVLFGIGLVLECIYLLCLVFTYLFSMNADEMLCLASFDRYHKTMLIFLSGLLLLVLLSNTASVRSTRNAAILQCTGALFVGVAFIALCECDVNAILSRDNYRNYESQGYFLSIKNQCQVSDGARYLIYTKGSDADTWEMRYEARYVFNADNVSFWQYPDECHSLEEIQNQYDYLIVYQHSQEIDDIIEQFQGSTADSCYSFS